MKKEEPLVSICIPNYNYGQYLRHCLDSVIAQTYSNIEVIIQDNASTDDSYEIITEYQSKYLRGESGVYIDAARNKRNKGSDLNSIICSSRVEGKYLMFLSSDDAIKPTFIEKCVKVMEENQNVSMVMVHRDEIDENGNLYETPPFYNTSCIVNGEDQAAVFMMAGIAVPSQILQRTESNRKMNQYRFYQLSVAGDWYNNFLLSCVGDIAYLKESLCEYRIHTGNETNESEKNLVGIFEHFIIINAFRSTANSIGYREAEVRYPKAVEKLGTMCLRYALKMLQNKEFLSAKKYLHLAPVLKVDIEKDEMYKKLWNLVELEGKEQFEEELNRFERENVLVRTVSYDPPAGYRKLSE